MSTVHHMFEPPPRGDLDQCSRAGCGVSAAWHDSVPVTLPSGPPVRSDYERALERIRELEDREKANADHFQTVWDQLTEQKLLRDANEERIRELEERLKAPSESEAHTWKRRALDAESQLLRNIDTIETLRERIRLLESRATNLAEDLYSSEEERLKAVTRAGDLELRLNESLKREGALIQRLNNLDTLAREVLARVERMNAILFEA